MACCPARLEGAEIDRLVGALAGTQAKVRIDLTACEISTGPLTVQFQLDDMWRTKLIKGWEDIDLTLQHAGKIARYRAHRRGLGWILPADRTA
jgi:3-isopropylmalate/(R)-2-methylmalate dehydratase small subunit